MHYAAQQILQKLPISLGGVRMFACYLNANLTVLGPMSFSERSLLVGCSLAERHYFTLGSAELM